VSSAWGSQGRPEPSKAQAERQHPPLSDGSLQQDEGPAIAVATVNGREIPRARLTSLLLRSHGILVLEQLIGLETAEAAATARGLTVTQADVDREYDRALRRLGDPLSSVTPQDSDRQSAERLLEAVLAQRRVSREEFDLIMRRNAYLRKIVESRQVFTEEQVRQEFQRNYGKRVQVRHIQLATLREVEQVKERLAGGEDFGELATRYSANTASAKEGGLLAPFSEEDETVPSLFRRVAFALGEGGVSDALRVDEWYHLIKLEKVIPSEDVAYERVREEVVRSLRERVTEPAMFELFAELFDGATIEIHDAALRESFLEKHSDRGR
jgi:parvulin-like peptidyl-prolyl isomerase